MKSYLDKKNLYTVASVIVLIGIWHLAALRVGNIYLLPTPVMVFERFIEIITTKGFFAIVLNTLKRALYSFGLTFLVASVTGILAGIFPVFFYLFKPIILLKKSVPTISIILILLLWFREKAPIYIGFIVIFPIIYTNVVTGIKDIDGDLLTMAESYKVSRLDTIKDIYIPSIVPYLMAGASSAIGINLKVVIAAEAWSNSTNSIGDALLIEKIGVSLDGLLAWTIVAIIIAGLLDLMLGQVEKRLVRWK